MEKPKKNSCGCFGFLRKRTKKQLDRSVIIESIEGRENEEIFQKPKDLNSSVDHSLVTTQKIFSPANFYKSTIIAPSCKTPQVHNIIALPELQLNNFKVDFSQNSHLLTNTHINLREISENCIILQEKILARDVFERDIKQKILFPEDKPVCDLKTEEKKAEERSAMDKIKVIEPVLSPGLEVLGKSTVDKNFPMLEISPIKSIISVDDYSDIVAAMTSAEGQIPMKRNIHELFIKNIQKSKQLPLLKPTTPRYLGRRNPIPRMRRDNQIFLEHFLYK